ncbi:MAG: ankyrin repeat domain-containing protein [Candidatus Anstonellales archaeon]
MYNLSYFTEGSNHLGMTINFINISDFIDYIRSGIDIETIVRNLKSYSDIYNLVLASLYCNDHKSLDILLNKYFDINSFYEDNISILHIRGISNTSVETCNVLEKYMINFRHINLKDAAGFTPLMIACYHGNINMIKMILRTFKHKIKYDNSLNNIISGNLCIIDGYDDIIDILLSSSIVGLYSKRRSGRKFLSKYINYVIRTNISHKSLYKSIKNGLDVLEYFDNILSAKIFGISNFRGDKNFDRLIRELIEITCLLIDNNAVNINSVVSSFVNNKIGNVLGDIVLYNPDIIQHVLHCAVNIKDVYNRRDKRWLINLLSLAKIYCE